MNEWAPVYDEYKEQVFLQHIVVEEPDKHNRIEEDYGIHTSEVEENIEQQAKVTIVGLLWGGVNQ